MLSDTWKNWSPQTRMAITVITLAGTPQPLEGRQFHLDALLCDLRNFNPELRALKKQGYIKQSASNPSGWRVYPKAFEWWLADELVRTVRDEQAFAQWIQAQEWDGLLTKGEKKQLVEFAKMLSGPLKEGIAGLIKNAVG